MKEKIKFFFSQLWDFIKDELEALLIIVTVILPLAMIGLIAIACLQ